MSQANQIQKGFLKRYRTSDEEEILYLPLKCGFLRLEYDNDREPMLLMNASFVAEPSRYAQAIGRTLSFRLSLYGQTSQATFLKKNAISGLQWSGGHVSGGTTLDIENSGGKHLQVSLDAWVDDCITDMINPGNDILNAISNRFNIAGAIRSIKTGSTSALNSFWESCTPVNEDGLKQTLDLLQYAVAHQKRDIVFACIDPLKRSLTGQRTILNVITALLESRPGLTHENRSGLEEILSVHCEYADDRLKHRWLKYCKTALTDYGAEALLFDHDGWFFTALCGVHPGGEEFSMFRSKIIDTVNSAPEEIRESIIDSLPYRCFNEHSSG